MTAELVQLLNERAGCGLQLLGVIDRGQSGAAYVRWPDGRESVVTTAFATLQRMELTREILDDASRLGLPVPRHEFLLEVSPGTVAVVQERLPGVTPTVADRDTLAAIVELNDRFAHLLADRPQVPVPRLSLGRPDDPIRARPVEQHSTRAGRLVRAMRRLATDSEGEIEGDDLLHVDLTVPNMLFDSAGTISGAVDWNYGVARGDRRFALVKLLHTSSYAAQSPDAETVPTTDGLGYLVQVVQDRLDPATFRRYWAHQTLNMLSASLHWGTAEAFERHLSLGESRLLVT